MRILHVTDHFPPVTGGIESHVANLSRWQAAAGHDVRVLTSTPAGASGRAYDAEGPVHVIRARSLLDGLRRAPHDDEVVHAHVSVVAPFTAPVVAAMARRGAPSVVTVHSLWNGLGPLPAWAAAVSGLRGAPVSWTAVSAVAARQVGHRLPRGRVVGLMPNAVDVAPRPRTRPSEGPIRVVSTMRLAARKRPVELIHLFDRLRDLVDVPVELVLIGDGPLRPRVEHEIRRRRLTDVVTLHGEVDNAMVRRVLAGCDVYVAPAVLESFGLAALEARAVGLPVVGLSSTGLTEFVRHGVEGLLGRDDRELVEAMAHLVRDPVLRTSISEHNRCFPSTHTWPRALRCHDEAYTAALDRRTIDATRAVLP